MWPKLRSVNMVSIAVWIFFSQSLARMMAKDGQIADLIVANNVLAHVPDIRDFVAGIKYILQPKGVMTI